MIGGQKLPDPANATVRPARQRLAAPGGDAAHSPPGRLLFGATLTRPRSVPQGTTTKHRWR